MSIGTVFTLLVLPVVYTYIAKRRQAPGLLEHVNPEVLVGE
jgi:hypothetical protein